MLQEGVHILPKSRQSQVQLETFTYKSLLQHAHRS